MYACHIHLIVMIFFKNQFLSMQKQQSKTASMKGSKCISTGQQSLKQVQQSSYLPAAIAPQQIVEPTIAQYGNYTFRVHLAKAPSSSAKQHLNRHQLRQDYSILPLPNSAPTLYQRAHYVYSPDKQMRPAITSFNLDSPKKDKFSNILQAHKIELLRLKSESNNDYNLKLSPKNNACKRWCRGRSYQQNQQYSEVRTPKKSKSYKSLLIDQNLEQSRIDIPEMSNQDKNQPNARLSVRNNSETNSSKNNSQVQSFTEYLTTQPLLQIRKNSLNTKARKVPSFLTNSKKCWRKSADLSELPPGFGISNFEIIKQLGKGTFGKVVLAIQKKSGTVCAIKILSKRKIMEDNMLEQLIRELKLQMYLNHPNIIKTYGFFDDILNFYIIMESAIDGHLSSCLNMRNVPLSEDQASVMLFQVCSAVRALHSLTIIHRDLKPENIMFHQGIVKISDFGWSVYQQSSLRSTFCGTPAYLCPEMLMGDEYDASIDIWAIGVIAYEMLFKANPFKITCKQELAYIIDSPIHFDQTMSISDSARDFIQQCLAKKAVNRPNIRQLMFHELVLNGQKANEIKR